MNTLEIPKEVNDSNLVDYVDTYLGGQSIANIYITKLLEETLREEVHLDSITVDSISDVLDKYYLKHEGNISNEVNARVIILMQRLNNISSNLLKSVAISYDIDYLFSNKNYLKKYNKELDKINKRDIINAFPAITKLNKEYISELSDSGNKLCLLVESGTRGSSATLISSLLSCGYKIDNNSNILPEFIEASYIKGITKPEDTYKIAVGARNAVLINANTVSDSGYIERKLNLLTKEIYSSIDDCGTNKTIDIKITDKNYKLLDGRNILLMGKPREVRTSYLKTQIGRTFKFFSPVCCEAKGNEICHKCYGRLVKSLKSFAKIGLISSSIFGNFVTQSLLSSKHLQNVRLPEYPTEYISYKDGKYISNIDAEFKYDSRDGVFIVTPNNPDIQPFSFGIPFDTEDLEDSVATVLARNVFYDTEGKPIKNSDTKRLLKQIKSVIEKTNEYKDINDIQTYLLAMHHLSEMINKNMPLVHCEVILSTMIRTKDYKLFRNSSTEGEQPVILGATKVLTNINNMIDLLSFERINNTLSRFDLINKETSFSSIEELLFSEA